MEFLTQEQAAFSTEVGEAMKWIRSESWASQGPLVSLLTPYCHREKTVSYVKPTPSPVTQHWTLGFWKAPWGNGAMWGRIGWR